MSDKASDKAGDKSNGGRGLRERVFGTWRQAVDSVGVVKDTVGDLINSVDADVLYDHGDDIADTKAPKVDIAQRWDERKFSAKLVNPANRRKLSVIIVGTGLAGASAAASRASRYAREKAS